MTDVVTKWDGESNAADLHGQAGIRPCLFLQYSISPGNYDTRYKSCQREGPASCSAARYISAPCFHRGRRSSLERSLFWAPCALQGESSIEPFLFSGRPALRRLSSQDNSCTLIICYLYAIFRKSQPETAAAQQGLKRSPRPHTPAMISRTVSGGSFTAWRS